MEWKKGVMEIVERINLNANNRNFIAIINEPLGFDHSSPGAYNEASANNNGETKWQRKLYKEEACWCDLELPIGQEKREKQWGSLRVDLIGMNNARPIICELKYTQKAGQPFDAILQLLAYYCMIVQNAEKLDREHIHHTNVAQSFKWTQITNNPLLMLRANHAYWENWEKSTKKNMAARQIVQLCKDKGLDILLVDENTLL